MATNHVNKGLSLLVGAAVAIALFYLVEGQIAHSAAQEVVEMVNKQTAEMQQHMQQQIQQMFKLPNRAN
jgi:predicted RecA/RadA family phage recombinase